MKRWNDEFVRRWKLLGWLSVVAIPAIGWVSGGSVSGDQWALRGLIGMSALTGIGLGIVRRR